MQKISCALWRDHRDEWRETIAKARGILAALGLHETDLEAL